MSGTVQREVVLPVAPEELWGALTEADQLAEWFADSARVELREGGEAVFEWADESRRGVVESVEVGRRLSFRWADAGADGEVTRVEFTLEPVGAGTLLRVVESGLPQPDGFPGIAACLGAEQGWTRLLQRLRVVAGVARVA